MVAQNRVEPPARAVEGDDARVRLVYPFAKPLQPVGHPPTPPPHRLRDPVDQVAHEPGKEDHDAHQHADAADDRETSAEEIVERETEQVSPLAQ